MRLKVTGINSADDPYKPQGKNYTVYRWDVDGELDGKPLSGIRCDSLSHKVAKDFGPGWEGEVEEQNFKGRVSYKIPTPKMDDGTGSWSGQRSSAPSSNKSFHDLCVEYMACLDSALAIAKKNGISDEQAMVAMGATLYIQAERQGIKPELKQPKAPEPPPSLIEDGPEDDLPF
jgi:hypothetical protein